MPPVGNIRIKTTLRRQARSALFPGATGRRANNFVYKSNISSNKTRVADTADGFPHVAMFMRMSVWRDLVFGLREPENQ